MLPLCMFKVFSFCKSFYNLQKEKRNKWERNNSTKLPAKETNYATYNLSGYIILLRFLIVESTDRILIRDASPPKVRL